MQEDSNRHGRVCDFCSESTALLYCKADSAKLCLSCDRVVHSTNDLFKKHTRFQLCDNCHSSASSIFCCTHNSVLCQNCDFELHDVCFDRHDRRPVEGFCGCPSVCELQGFVGFQGFNLKSKEEGFLEEEVDGFFDWSVWENHGVVSIGELMLHNDATQHSFQATVVPPLPKDRNLSCGKHKLEILHQLTELAKSEPNATQDSTPPLGNQILVDQIEEEFSIEHMFQHYARDEEQDTLAGHRVLEPKPASSCSDVLISFSYANANANEEAVNEIFLSPIIFGSNNENHVTSTLDSHDNASNSDRSFTFTQKVCRVVEGGSRDSALCRYKEKRRSRRYEKHIRYESRKVQAENRTRLRGRFAKDRKPCTE